MKNIGSYYNITFAMTYSVILLNTKYFMIMIALVVEKAVLNNGYHPAEVVKELLQHNA